MFCCSRTSGALKALESSIWIVYDTALEATLQLNVIGWSGLSPFTGPTRPGADGTEGGAGGVDTAPSFATKPSP